MMGFAALYPSYGLCSLARDDQLRRLLRLPIPQEAPEQPAPALARDEVDVADEFCAALAPLQHDLAAVEGFELRAMGDADDGGRRQFFRHHLHHLVLTLVVERRRRLIQHDDVG